MESVTVVPIFPRIFLVTNSGSNPATDSPSTAINSPPDSIPASCAGPFLKTERIKNLLSRLDPITMPTPPNSPVVCSINPL